MSQPLTQEAVFEIEFTTNVPEPQEEDWDGLWGRITLGDYQEDFLSPLSLWPRERYERQWREAAERLVAGSSPTAFFTSAFQFSWGMWRDGDEVRVRQQFLHSELVDSLGSAPDLDRAPYELLGDYHRTAEDGEAISEWRLDMADVEAFRARHGGS